jgi:hypothetical protein
MQNCNHGDSSAHESIKNKRIKLRRCRKTGVNESISLMQKSTQFSKVAERKQSRMIRKQCKARRHGNRRTSKEPIADPDSQLQTFWRICSSRSGSIR